MEKTNFQNICLYTHKYAQSVYETANKIHQQKQGKITYKDFNSIDLLHPGRFQGLNNFLQKYPQLPQSLLIQLGSGYGGTSRYLHFQFNFKIFGFDILKHQIQVSNYINNLLQISPSQITHITGDAVNIQLNPNYYDIAISIGSLMYIPQSTALINLLSSLKTGGFLYIQQEYLLKSKEEFTQSDWQIYNYKKMFGTVTQPEILEILSSNHFQVLQVSDFSSVWSENVWNTAQKMLQSQNTSQEQWNNQLKTIQLLSHLQAYSPAQISQKYPFLSQTLNIHQIIYQNPKLAAVHIIIARKL